MAGSPDGAGDHERLRALYEDNRDVVFRYAVSRVGRESAMDVVADTFIEAGRDRGRFDPARGSENAWLLGIATNLIRRHHRSERKFAGAETIEAADGIEDARIASLPGRIDAQRQALEVRRAIDALPEGERAAILLHAVEGMEIGEVAEALRISGTAAKVRIFRARRRLRDSLPHLDETKENK